MEQIEEISNFFNFPVPWKNSLSEKVKVYAPNVQRQKLVDVCRKRWLERIDGMIIFEKLFVSIYHSLREMKENKCEPRFNNETSAKADSVFKSVTDLSFITTLVITRNVLDYLLPVTRKL